MSRKSLSIIIVSYNCWNHISACLKSVFASDLKPDEIVVIDNASVDKTPERLAESYGSGIRLVVNPVNTGHARAVNQGLRLVNADRVLLLDADTELKPDMIRLLCEFMDSHPGASMAAPRMYGPDGALHDSARNFPSAINGLFGRQSLLTRLFPRNRFSRRYLATDRSGDETPFRVEHVSAACMLFDRSVVGAAGLWDEGYSGYWVDADWCKRIGKSGGVIYCVPAAVVIHHEQNSRTRKKNPARIVSFHAGVYRFYRIHYTYGAWDPRSIAAAAFLALRALSLLTINAFKKPQGLDADPLSIRK